MWVSSLCVSLNSYSHELEIKMAKPTPAKQNRNKLMYTRQLKNRKQRMMALLTSPTNQTPAGPLTNLFGASFLDDFRIEYEPKEFADIDWGSQKNIPNWERQTAS
jgi:hypothetical protein